MLRLKPILPGFAAFFGHSNILIEMKQIELLQRLLLVHLYPRITRLKTLDCDNAIAADVPWKLCLVRSENIPGNVARCSWRQPPHQQGPLGWCRRVDIWPSPELVDPWYSSARESVQPTWNLSSRIHGTVLLPAATI